MCLQEGLEGVVQRLTQQQQLEPDDITYECVELQKGNFCATVLVCSLGNINFTGEICDNKADAWRSAAFAALAEFAAVGQEAAEHMSNFAGGGRTMKQTAPVAQEQLVPGELGEMPPELETQGNGHVEDATRAAKRPRITPQPGAAGAGPALRAPLPVGLCRLPTGDHLWPTGGPSTPLLPSDGGPCMPVGRGAPLVRPSPLFQKRPNIPAPNISAIGANAKGQLNELLARLLGRPLTKDDMAYHMTSGPGGFRAHLVVPCLGSEAYTGNPSSKRKDAEQNAAAVAISALQSSVPGQVPAKTAINKAKRKASPMLPLGGASLPALPAPSPKPGGEDTTTELQEWQRTRLEPPDENDAPESQSLDLWYGQVCLLCLVVCPKSGFLMHAAGQKHQRRFETCPMKKRREVPRPPTAPSRQLLPAGAFVDTAGWANLDAAGNAGPVLIVGEMDFSFSLAVARLRPAGSFLVATSYLEEHDPAEPEVYPSDDGERASYSRRTLPAMNGALFRNLQALNQHGAEVKFGVDAMQLQSTLRPQGVDGAFERVVFPFPRATLHRACDPRNSRLLRNFFLSVTQEGFVSGGGAVQLVMLGSQYEEWDVACMAAEAGLQLTGRAALPADFYQSREMSGKPWQPQGAELLCFGAAY